MSGALAEGGELTDAQLLEYNKARKAELDSVAKKNQESCQFHERQCQGTRTDALIHAHQRGMVRTKLARPAATKASDAASKATHSVYRHDSVRTE